MLRKLFENTDTLINEDFFDDASVDIEVEDKEEAVADDTDVTGYDYIMFASFATDNFDVVKLSDKHRFMLKKYMSDGLCVDGITAKFAPAELLLKYDMVNETDIDFKSLDEIYDIVNTKTDDDFKPQFSFRYIKFYIPKTQFTPKRFVKLLTELWDVVIVMLQSFGIRMNKIEFFSEGAFKKGVYEGISAFKWSSAKAMKSQSVDIKKGSDKFFLETILETMEGFDIIWPVETFEEKKKILYSIVGPSVNGITKDLNRALLMCGMRETLIRKLQFISAKNLGTLVIIIPENNTVNFDNIDIDGIRAAFKSNTFNRVKIRVQGTLKISTTQGMLNIRNLEQGFQHNEVIIEYPRVPVSVRKFLDILEIKNLQLPQ